MARAEWTKCLDEASKRSIRWYPQWNERNDMIIRCGGFPNVPLMGTQGVINYNPELVLRQVGYKAWFKRKHEWVGLTFGDPRLDVNEESDLGSTESCRSFKRKLESDPDP
ncbi:hypothetical protein CR513_57829, partial [Mucuna pruriens]